MRARLASSLCLTSNLSRNRQRPRFCSAGLPRRRFAIEGRDRGLSFSSKHPRDSARARISGSHEFSRPWIRMSPAQVNEKVDVPNILGFQSGSRRDFDPPKRAVRRFALGRDRRRKRRIEREPFSRVGITLLAHSASRRGSDPNLCRRRPLEFSTPPLGPPARHRENPPAHS